MKKMKFIFTLLLVLTVLAGCSSGAKKPEKTESQAPTEVEIETEVTETQIETESEETEAVVEPFDAAQLYKALEYNSEGDCYKISDDMYINVEYIEKKPEIPEFGDYHLLVKSGMNLCTIKNTTETELTGYNMAANEDYLFFCWYEGGQANGYKSTVTKISLYDAWTESTTEIDHCNHLYGVYKNTLYMGCKDESGSYDLTRFEEETGISEPIEFPEDAGDTSNLQICEVAFDRYIVVTGQADEVGLCSIYVVDMATGDVIVAPEPGEKDTITIEDGVLFYRGQADSVSSPLLR